jgi:ATPase subunit of ABC transporter with duplicated ATPase domains
MGPEKGSLSPSKGRSQKGSGRNNEPVSLSFRLRGSQESGGVAAGEWQQPPTDENEEEQLRKDLKRAQKKMKKQEQLQEWLRAKEERAVAEQQEQQEQLRAQQRDEDEKERKRLSRAKKAKKKLMGYEATISLEKQKIQELMSYGIDPESLIV